MLFLRRFFKKGLTRSWLCSRRFGSNKEEPVPEGQAGSSTGCHGVDVELRAVDDAEVSRTLLVVGRRDVPLDCDPCRRCLENRLIATVKPRNVGRGSSLGPKAISTRVDGEQDRRTHHIEANDRSLDFIVPRSQAVRNEIGRASCRERVS